LITEKRRRRGIVKRTLPPIFELKNRAERAEKFFAPAFTQKILSVAA